MRLLFWKRTRLNIAAVTFVAALPLGYAIVSSITHSVLAQTPAGPPPIPSAGPLAEAKSLSQVRVPVEVTRAAAPADNPQTQEKIALGKKLFFLQDAKPAQRVNDLSLFSRWLARNAVGRNGPLQ